MANEYPYPEFLEETMFAEQGTKVLITDPAADVLLEKARQRKLIVTDQMVEHVQTDSNLPNLITSFL